MPPKQPPVTMLIPTHNREKSIQQVLDCCFAQTYPNIKVLIYDDGSTDGTSRIIRRCSDSRLRALHGGKNKGVSIARTRLLEESDTEFNAWMDSDDIMSPYRIGLQMQAMHKWETPFVRTSCRALTPERRATWRQPPDMYYAMRQTPPTSLFRMSCSPGPFDHTLRFLGEDVLWETQMVVNHGTGIVLPFVLYCKGRGRDRLSARVLSAEGPGWRVYFDRVRKAVVSELHRRNINAYCRVERVTPDQLDLPFPMPRDNRTAEGRRRMDMYWRVCNICTSRRLKDTGRPLEIWKCPLCGALLEKIVCKYCGRDWSPFGHWVKPPAKTKETPEPDHEVEKL